MLKTKTESSTSFDRAVAHYHKTIKHQLTDADKGRFIAIHPETGEWEIGDGYEVVDKLRERFPGVIPAIIRHVYIAAQYWGTVPPEFQYEIRDADWIRARI